MGIVKIVGGGKNIIPVLENVICTDQTLNNIQ